jgi:hypothetical protein
MNKKKHVLKRYFVLFTIYKRKCKEQMLRRDFENLSMKESETIDSFFTEVIGLITQIRSHGDILEDRRIVEKILRCLPSRFESIVVVIEQKISHSSR